LAGFINVSKANSNNL